MSADTHQEVELSKQAIHFTSEIDRLRASNGELRDIIAEYQELLGRTVSPPAVLHQLDFRELHDKAIDKLTKFHKIFGRLYWYK